MRMYLMVVVLTKRLVLIVFSPGFRCVDLFPMEIFSLEELTCLVDNQYKKDDVFRVDDE